MELGTLSTKQWNSVMVGNLKASYGKNVNDWYFTEPVITQLSSLSKYAASLAKSAG
jgi:hypothetical protein